MNSRTMTGRFLILGPLGIMVTWMAWGGVMGFPEASDAAATIAAISENADMTKILMAIVGGFMFIMVAGLQGLRNTMNEGPGSNYAAIGVLIVTMSAAISLGELAMSLGVADAGSAGAVELATTLYYVGSAIGVVSSAGMFLGFATIALAVYLQKNHNQIISGLLFITAVFGLIVALVDYTNNLMIVGYMGMTVSVILIGVSTLRSSE